MFVLRLFPEIFVYAIKYLYIIIMESGMQDDKIKITVRDRYAEIARGVRQSCCVGTADAELYTISVGYNTKELGDTPAGSNLGLGCGNPLGKINIEEGWTVLDLGSGAGFDCFIAARSVGVTGKVIGVDMTPEMIDRARINAEQSGITNVEFRLGDIEMLPVDDASVDIIISNCVINLSPDKPAVFREAYRVLKPGGKLAISDIITHTPIPEDITRDMDLYAGCVAGAVTENVYTEAIWSAGFQNIKITRVNNSESTAESCSCGTGNSFNVFSAYITAEKPLDEITRSQKERTMDSKEYFDNIASGWDEFRKGLFPESVRDRAYLEANLTQGSIAVDLGAGTGFITEGLLRRGVQVIAIDQSSAMIEVMRKKFGENTLIRYEIGTAEHIPLPASSVDYVFANMYLHHVESPQNAMVEIARILEPGGKVIITDLDEHSFEFLCTEQHDRWMGFKREDITRWFLNAGFHDVRVDCVGDSCCSTSSDDSDEASVSIFIATGTKDIT
jgi:arsenite methyltransferase